MSKDEEKTAKQGPMPMLWAALGTATIVSARLKAHGNLSTEETAGWDAFQKCIDEASVNLNRLQLLSHKNLYPPR